MSATTPAGARDKPDTLQGFAIFCIVIYICIYAFESPVRYALYLTGLNTLILLRDGLVILPIVLLCLRDVLRGTLRPSVAAYLLATAIGFAVSFLNFGAVAIPVLGAKMLLGVLFGLMAGFPLIVTGRYMQRLFLILWLLTVLGVVLEKFFVSFPWVGLHAMIGNVDVEISRDWQITDDLQKRVGGFTKVSISAAGLIPLLAFIATAQLKSFFVRNAMLLVSAGSVFLTTQKGAFAAIVLVWGTLLVPQLYRGGVQIAAALGALLLEVAAPILTYGLRFDQVDGGSYSASSLIDRITITWPDTWAWLEHRQIFPFGVGLGGVGEAQRFASTAAFHYPDNMFLFLISSMGILGAAFLAVIGVAIVRATWLPPQERSCTLSVLTFILIYGVVVSVIEDQMEALFLGATLGVLLAPRRQPAPIPTGRPSGALAAVSR